jgi:rhodanese-related sulfurtransferase
MKEISPSELKQLIDSKAVFQLVDVREDYEYEEMNLNGLHIPMGEVLDRASEIDKNKQVVVHCRSGKRSASVINALEAQHGYTNLYNLRGGILGWIDEVGPIPQP